MIFLFSLKTKAQIEDFPKDFKEKAFSHIETLSSYGFRKAGTDSEVKTVNYLKSKFEEIGLQVKIDTF